MRSSSNCHSLSAPATTGPIDKADPADVRAFLAAHADGPLADPLRRDWLKALANAGDWDTFRREFPALQSEDTEVACHALADRLQRGDKEALAEARTLFLAGREAPTACDGPFTAAAAEGLVGPAEAWTRIRRLLAADKLRDARKANAMLPAREQFAEKALDRAHGDPARFLESEKGRPPSRAASELIVHAAARLARQRPDEAASRLEQLARTVGAEDLRYGFSLVGHAAAQSHHPRALEYFERAGEGPFGEGHLAWKVRAALRAGDWAAVRGAINQMPASEARDPAWRYWLARALAESGAKSAAEDLWRALAPERHFYGLLAAEQLGAIQPPDWAAQPVAAEDLDRVRAIPAVGRALALYRAELNPEAFREWAWGLRGLDDRGLLAASVLAEEAGLADRAIGAAERTAARHDWNRRFPVPHREALAQSARTFGVDEALVYGIIRQESRFNAEARSRVGAMGLMQLMPATARWVAKQIPIADYRPAKLADPATNVAMGTYYFRRVLTDLGDPVLATAGYNAGPGRARRWQADRPLEGAIYAESIPFNETRDYVKKVMANAWFYGHRLTGTTPSLRAIVGTVPGRGGANAAAVASLP